MTNEEDKVLTELRRISKLLTLAHSKQIEFELSKVASTDERKRMWVLIDGKNMAKDIARILKVSERTVSYFISQATNTGFVESTPRKPAIRSIDYVPPAWIELLPEIEEKPTEGAETPMKQEKNQASIPPDQRKLEGVN